MEAGGLDVAFEGGDQPVVGEGGEFVEIGADDHFGEKGGGRGADGAAVAFEASGFNDRFVQFHCDPYPIAAQWIEALVTDIRGRQVAVIAWMPEVIQKGFAVERRHRVVTFCLSKTLLAGRI